MRPEVPAPGPCKPSTSFLSRPNLPQPRKRIVDLQPGLCTLVITTGQVAKCGVKT